VFRAVDKALGRRLPVIAEDLGLITQEVTDLREELEYPGMRVLQFAWDGPESEHLPHNVPYTGTVIYTGTHDNDTAKGFAEKATPAQRRFLRDYLGRGPQSAAAAGDKRKRTEGDKDVSAAANKTDSMEVDGAQNGESQDEAKEVIENAHWDLIRLALSSTADTAILQVQDVLGLGSEARMNTPATTDGNWAWRFNSFDKLTHEDAAKLKKMTVIYGRTPKKAAEAKAETAGNEKADKETEKKAE